MVLVSCKGTIGDPAGSPDAQAAPPVDAASWPDARVLVDADTPLPDAAPPDATVPDATVPDAPPPPPTCDQLYGAAPSYVLCAETPTTCEFNARTDGSNCNDMCSRYGGICVDAHDNNSVAGEECQIQGLNDDCTTLRSTEICVCTRF